MTADYAPGFTSLAAEVEDVALPVDGELPAWLSGTLFRNGPARFEAGKVPFRHWFDGQAMLHRFAVGDGAVSYTNRFIDSATKRATDAGRIGYREFASDPCQRYFSRLFTRFRPAPRFVPNANVNIVPMAEGLTALTEVPLAASFDAKTLATVGVAAYTDSLDGRVTTAHPHQSPRTGDLVNYLLSFGQNSFYQVYRQPVTSMARDLVARIPVARPGYMHSFAITENFVVLAEFPLTVNPLKLLLSGKPFIDNYRWDPQGETRFLVVDMRNGSLRGDFRTAPFFAFHHINAFEQGDVLVLDICAYEDASVIDALRLDALRDEVAGKFAFPTRYEIDLDAGTVSSRRLAGVPLELPRIHYGQHNGHPYRYAYGITGDSEGPVVARGLAKVDVETGGSREWSQPRNYPGEPVFVPEPGADAEDQGVVLSVVLDADAGTSKLVVLDAQSFQELASAKVPHTIPFGFHGLFHSAR
ncbi:carotenoid oxygenase family protein [Catenulispora subtropica]|uniref:Dioxygenase n=1 Tax=Catenulispora subtropica TaxID=450798 RepID=A0ABN2T5R5_9ACTN